MTPRRVRIRGDLYHQRIPDGAVAVTRGRGPWGNPHPVSRPRKPKPCPVCGGALHDQAEAVALYRAYLATRPELVARARLELAGRDLACWCRPGDPCHADTLLQVANGGEP